LRIALEPYLQGAESLALFSFQEKKLFILLPILAKVKLFLSEKTCL